MSKGTWISEERSRLGNYLGLGRRNGGETPQNPDRKVPNLKEWGLGSQGGASPYMATHEHVLCGSLALTKALQEQDVGAFGRPWPLS